MLNALTVDVEDYFQVTAFEKSVSRDDWGTYPLRVAANTERILSLLEEHGVTATFFILGWVAERLPGLVKKITAHGHEIACHGYGHELVYAIGPDRFRDDIRRAKMLLEELSGVAVNGYRAPSYSITGQSLWALDILVEEGFTYDSSIFPVHHDIYGMPDAPRFPYLITRPGGTLKEFPLSTMQLTCGGRGLRIPIAGGGYLRLLPVSIIEWGIHRVNRLEKKPAVLYFHPWEIDPEQPRIAACFRSRFRHYTNLDRTESKLLHLLGKFRFGTMRDVLAMDSLTDTHEHAVGN